MKRNKLMLPILAVIVGIAASAFTTSKMHPTSQVWFTYNSGATNPGQNTNYSLASGIGSNPGCPTAPSTVCAVLADPDPNNSNIPNQSELTTIQNQSNNFTQPNDNIEYKP